MEIKYQQAKKFGIVNKVIEHWRSFNLYLPCEENFIIKSWKRNASTLRVNKKWLLQNIK